MTDATKCIEKMLELRFGKMEAEALKFGRARVERQDVQFTDIKHMATLCDRYRARARMQILAYRLWRETHKVSADPLSRLYGAAEGASLHRRVSDDVKLWYFAHRDYHAMRKEFLKKCVGPTVRVEWQKAG